MSGFVVWFTGLSGAGKSTLAALLASVLRGRGVHVEVLDGDEVRTHLSKGLTFSREDRDTNIRRIGFVAKLLARSGACAITAAISPFRAIRDEQRGQAERFVEVYCSSSIEALAARDPKGLYRKALAGEIKGFTGIDDPYEEPLAPEVVVYTDRETKEESLARIIATLEQLGYIAARASGAGRSPSSSLVPPHGGELVGRRVASQQADALMELARSLPVIDLDAESEVDVELLAMGAYSPLEGFLTSKDWLRVLAEMRLENGLPWPVPVGLPVGEDVARGLRPGMEVALRSRDGRLVAVIDVSDVYCPEELVRGRTIVGPFGEADPEMLRQRARGPSFVGGKVRVFGEHPLGVRTPADTRVVFASQGLVAGMRTRQIPRRAEEHIARLGLDATGALLWQVLDGPGPLPLAVRLSCHEVLVQKYFPAKRVVVAAGLGHFAVGLRAAILDAIVCQNHGCSHVVLGQGSAGDVRQAFRSFAPGELAIVPLFFEEAGFCAVTSSMVTARSVPGGAVMATLSETEILDEVTRGAPIAEEVVRLEVTAILRRSDAIANGSSVVVDSSSAMEGGWMMPPIDDRAIWDTWLSIYNLPSVAVADELGICMSLHERPAGPIELAERLGYDQRATLAVVRMLAALGYLQQQEGIYHLTSRARWYLLKDSPYHWGPMLRGRSNLQARLRERLLGRSPLGVPGHRPGVWGEGRRRRPEAPNVQPGELSGESVPEGWAEGQIDIERAKQVAAVMHAHSLPAAVGLAHKVDFSNVSRLLDVGAGSGCYAISLAHTNGAMRATLMDLPAVCKVATEYIAASGLAERIDTVAVDMFRGVWPLGYDAVFFANVWHDWNVETCAWLAQKTFDVLPEGGRILVHEMLLDDDGDGPLTTVAFSMHMLNTEGQQFRLSELEELLERAGFVDIKAQPTYGYYSLVEARKPT